MATALIGRNAFGSGPWPGRWPAREAAGNELSARARRPRLSPGQRERLVMAHLPRVRSIASRLRRRLPPQVGAEDLFHAGVVGLIEAVDHYDPRKSPGFWAFAELRIRGAIFDSLRELDWAPRSLRRCGRHLERVKEDLRRKLGRPADEFEAAQAMELAVEDYRHLTAELCGLHLASLDEETGGDSRKFPEPHAQGSDPFELCLQAEIGAVVAAAAELNERERRVLALYYGEELTMKEVAGVLGLAESRVCQLHAAALGKVRARMGEGFPSKSAQGKNPRAPVPFRQFGVVSHDRRSRP